MSPEQIRLLFLIGYMGQGGAQVQARLLLKSLTGLGVEAHLACFAGPPEDLAGLSGAGVQVHLLPKPRRGIWPMMALFHMLGMVRRYRIQVVQSFLTDFDATAPLMRTVRPGLRVVTSRRNVDDSLSPRHLRLIRWAGPLASAVVANSNAVAASVRRLEGNLGTRLRVIPNAMELPPPISAEERDTARRAYGYDDQSFVIAYPAHFRQAKGHVYLPEIARLLRAIEPRARFLLAGATTENSDYRKNYAIFREAVAAQDLSACFHYVGRLEDSRPVLAAADVVLNVSDCEGMSNTVMEAMAHALPVVATTVGGAPELLDDGREGWLIAAGDTAAAADRLTRLAADPEACRRMGASGLARIARDFSVPRMSQAYLDLYKELLRG
jgi:L-malate glycosyltransferase